MNVVLPIKDEKKIKLMKLVLRDQNDRGQGVRNLLLFVMGINTALRVSDLLALTIDDVRDDKGRMRPAVTLKEAKTGKLKQFPLNDSILEVLEDHLRSKSSLVSPTSLFSSYKTKQGLTRTQAYRILSSAAKAVGLEGIGTHTLRKTFGYHMYKRTGNLALVQKLLNHSSSGDTLRYIGIDQENMDEAYLKLNL